MLQTPLCRDLGIEFPILSVGMSWLAGPELVAKVGPTATEEATAYVAAVKSYYETALRAL